MGPQAMSAGRNADATQDVEDVGEQHCLELGLAEEALFEAEEGAEVERAHEHDIAPDNLGLEGFCLALLVSRCLLVAGDNWLLLLVGLLAVDQSL